MLVKAATGLLAVCHLASVVFAQDRVAITGATVDQNSDVPARRNINDMYSKGGPQWDLYIQALRSLQAKNASDPLSYFQVAGIHGLPFIEWNGDGPRNNDGWGGYCPHGEAIFLPWHRALSLLYEQLLVKEAVAIASKYPQRYRTEYLAAANSLRSPYWDWSADSNVPPSTVPQTMSINVPDGQGIKQAQVTNPLQPYTLPQEALSRQFGPFARIPAKMVRCPAPRQYPNTPNQRLRQHNLKQSTYDMFSYSSTFNDFAVTGGRHLEGLHNIIHWEAGCEGQFLDATLSAFDPLFMLHHTHVDRLWTYWQFIRPSESVFKNSYIGQPRFSTPQGTVVGPNSPLAPFHDGNLNRYTSNSISSIKGMGYTYEGLEYWRKSSEQLRRDAIQRINTLYAPRGAFSKRSSSQTETRHFAHVDLDRTQVERPCTITVFIGDKEAGTVPIMPLPETGIARTSVPIDKFLNATMHSSSSQGIMASIGQLVEVEIKKLDGTSIPVDKVDSLKITVERIAVSAPSSNMELPKPVDKTRHAAKVQAHFTH